MAYGQNTPGCDPLIQILLPKLTVKSPSVTQRSVSQENDFFKAKTRRLTQNYSIK